MPGLSQILDIARRALAAQQMGMNVTSHNISNANTPGYSRQRLNLIASNPIWTTNGLLGTGVTIGSIDRIREGFIDQQIRLTNNSYGSATAQQTILSQVEANFNEPSDTGLGSLMTKFFNSFQDLSVHPEDTATRTTVLQAGTMLAQKFQSLNTNLTQLRSDLSNDAQSKVDQINSLTQQISDLNSQIVSVVAAGGNPGDAKDQRDLKIEQLSQLANINVTEDPRGSVTVSLGGILIASGSGPQALSTSMVGNKLQIVTSQGGSVVNASGGELGGTLKAYNSDIPSALARLDQLAGAIITRVNTLHSAGFGLGTPPPTGNNFFSGSTSGDIAVDPAIVNNINNIAASGSGDPGDNTVALALARVATEPLLNGNSVSVTQYYGSLVADVGSSVSAADTLSQSQQLILTQLQNQRSAESGVSLDEEMTNLIQYQRSYDAAARVVTTVDAMFQTLLNIG